VVTLKVTSVVVSRITFFMTKMCAQKCDIEKNFVDLMSLYVDKEMVDTRPLKNRVKPDCEV